MCKSSVGTFTPTRRHMLGDPRCAPTGRYGLICRIPRVVSLRDLPGVMTDPPLRGSPATSFDPCEGGRDMIRRPASAGLKPYHGTMSWALAAIDRHATIRQTAAAGRSCRPAPGWPESVDDKLTAESESGAGCDGESTQSVCAGEGA